MRSAWMMQVSADEIVSMVSMWNGFVAAAGTMLVFGTVGSALVFGSA